MVLEGDIRIYNVMRTLFPKLYILAVREDRMPGGRNGSAIYSLYKVCIAIDTAYVS